MPVIKVNDLDISKLTFSEVKTDNNGRKMVFVNYNGGKVIVQTPKMYVPNGIKRWRKKDAVDNKDDSFEMEMSFGVGDRTDKNSLEIKGFHDKMKQFDETVKNHILCHSKEMLGKPKISMELIENAFYAPTVRVPMDKEGNRLDQYPDRVRAKLDRERSGDDFTGRFLSHKRPPTELMIFDDNKTQLKMDENNFESIVTKGSQVVSVLELVYLTITTKVSAKWKLIQAKVARNETNITGYAMLDEPEDNLPDDKDSDNEITVPIVEDKDDEEHEIIEQVETKLNVDVDEELDEENDHVPVTVKPRGRTRKA